MQVKGTEPSYSAWKSPGFRNAFKGGFRHFAAFWAIEITTEFLFVGMAVAGVLSSRLPVVRARPHTTDQGVI